MAAKDDAKNVVDQFAARAGSGGGLWLHIKRTDLAVGLRARVDNPDLISSIETSLCGPAAFAHGLAIDDPVSYVKAAIDLWETGSAVIGTQSIKPKKDLKTYKLPATTTINPADWILLASMRDTDNWFFDYQEEGDDLSAITMPHTMEKWFKQAGYTEVLNDTNVVACKDLANARKASSLLGKGYKVCLFINSDMLYASKHNNASLIPDHWVGLVTGITITGIEADPASKVSFKVYTWGRVQSVPQSGDLSIKHFLNNYYGYIACRR
jgi:hypothetical protein